jgi:hypothetical protein
MARVAGASRWRGPFWLARGLCGLAEEDGLAAEECGFDGFEAALELGEIFEDPGGGAVVERRAEELALADELFVLRDEGGEGGSFFAEALGDAIVFGDGEFGEAVGELADAGAEPLELLGGADGGGVREGMGARRCGEVVAAEVAFSLLHAGVGGGEQPCSFRADELIVRAKLVFLAIEVVAPAVEEVGGQLAERTGVVEVEAGHYFLPSAPLGGGGVAEVSTE